MNRAVRSVGAIVLALLVSAAVGQIGGRIGVSLARASADPWGVAAVGVATLFILVPAVAGLVLGIVAPTNPAVLAIPLVMLSLLATYATLGIAGLPHGSKIAEYVVQTIIIALVATFVASRRKKGAFVAPAG